MERQPKRFCWIPGLLLALFMAAAIVHAGCPGVSLTEMRSLASLPVALRQLLPRQPQGLDGIAEPDSPFNATDAVNPKLPMRRFVVAAVGKDCAIVAVEHGGRGYNVEVYEFRLSEIVWHQVGLKYVFGKPVSVSDLVSMSGHQ
jgi:hypothetical protein